MKNCVKIPEGSFKLANNKGLKNDFRFYYILKSLNNHSKFYKKGLYKYISQQTGFSISQLYVKINNLVKLGWLIEKPDSYFLISYNKFWQSLGIDQSKHFKKNRLGNFKIFYISIHKLYKLETYIAADEINLNFSRQQYKIYKKKQDRSVYKFDSTKNDGGPKYRTKEFIDYEQTCKNYNEICEVMQKRNFDALNPYVQISTKGVANLLGYNSKSKGHKIEKQMAFERLFYVNSITTPYLPVETNVSDYMEKNKNFFDSTFILYSTSIHKQLCNSLIPC